MKIIKNSTIFKKAQRFADLTKNLIITGHIGKARSCIQIAEQLFLKGGNEVKTAIANVYLYSLSSFMELHHYNIKNLFPENLEREYYRQVYQSNI